MMDKEVRKAVFSIGIRIILVMAGLLIAYGIQQFYR